MQITITAKDNISSAGADGRWRGTAFHGATCSASEYRGSRCPICFWALYDGDWCQGPKPDPEGQNDSRAHHALQALQLFASLTGLEDEDPHTQAQDLLCNLMHLADRTDGLDFDAALSMAHYHYEAETEPDA